MTDKEINDRVDEFICESNNIADEILTKYREPIILEYALCKALARLIKCKHPDRDKYNLDTIQFSIQRELFKLRLGRK